MQGEISKMFLFVKLTTEESPKSHSKHYGDADLMTNIIQITKKISDYIANINIFEKTPFFCD